MWFIRGTDGLTTRQRKKMATEYRARTHRPLTESEKKARMEWVERKRQELKENLSA